MFKNKLQLIVVFLLILTFVSCASFEAKAAAEGNVEDISVYISNGGDLNARQYSGKTLLIIAAESGKVKMIEYLIQNGADTELIADNGKTAMIAAAAKGRINSVKALTMQGALIDGIGSRGSTALHYAASENHTVVISFLIDRGADINKVNDSGFSPLIEALFNNSGEDQGIISSVEFLINSGAVFNAHGKNIVNIAFETVESGNVELMELLISYGFDVRKRDVWGNSLLFSAVGHPRMLTFLLRKGLQPDVKNFDGNTALHEALYIDNEDSMAVLLSFRADPDERNKKGRTPLMEAATMSRPEYMRMLLISGANSSLRDYSNNNSLHYAVLYGDLESVRLLLIDGMNPNYPNGIGKTPLQLTEENEYFGGVIKELLFDAGAVE